MSAPFYTLGDFPTQVFFVLVLEEVIRKLSMPHCSLCLFLSGATFLFFKECFTQLLCTVHFLHFDSLMLPELNIRLLNEVKIVNFCFHRSWNVRLK